MVYKKLNSTGTLIQRTTTEAPQGTLCITSGWMFTRRRSVILRQECERSGSPGRQSWGNPLGTGQLDEDTPSTLDSGHGSNDFHRLDLRSSAAPRSAGEGSASADPCAIAAAKKKNDQIDASKIADCLRCDFLPECIDPDSRSTPNPALPAPAGAPDGADEESDLGFVDGNWSELQQAAATQSGLFPCDDQRRANATDWPIIWSRDYITHCRIRWLIL